MLEFYEAYQTWHRGLMDLTEDLVSGMAEHVTGDHAVEYGDVTLSFMVAGLYVADAVANYGDVRR